MNNIKTNDNNDRTYPIDEWIPRFYNPYLFVSITNLIGITGLFFLFSQATQIQWFEWLAVPIAVIFANLVEYLTHRSPMHHRKWWMPILHKRHMLIHHHYFLPEKMPIKNAREAYIVLFPPWAILLAFLVVIPMYFVLSLFLSTNIAILFSGTCVAYYLFFDIMHLTYHLPLSHPIFKISFIRRWQRHHHLHHDPRLRQRYNFNIAFPLWDHVFGTYYEEGEEASNTESLETI